MAADQPSVRRRFDVTSSCLKALASNPTLGRGRRLPEPAAPHRNDYQRDRDRVVHCTAFRRLVYKTQVFLNHEGDLFRTRLTHSLEVAQLARSMARSLGLHEDLVEAIALAHDLGHTPFGHAGQDALHDCMREHGGFEHNLQSLRVVDTLEERYAAFDGLNLCFETREGILKHCSLRHAQELEQREPGGVGSRFIARTQPSLEAQLCNLADEMAYSAHDIDDGVRSGLLHIDQLDELPLLRELHAQTRMEHPDLGGRRLLFEMVRRLINLLVDDVLKATLSAAAASGAASAEETRQAGPMVCFSAPLRAQTDELKRFLMRHLYRHEQVMASMTRAKDVVRVLFSIYESHPERMAAGFAQRPDRQRAIADYIAGMTDRFALKEYARWTGLDAMAGLSSAGAAPGRLPSGEGADA